MQKCCIVPFEFFQARKNAGKLIKRNNSFSTVNRQKRKSFIPGVQTKKPTGNRSSGYLPNHHLNLN